MPKVLTEKPRRDDWHGKCFHAPSSMFWVVAPVTLRRVTPLHLKECTMAITMQGSWTVAVKSKSARRPQRFIVSGATSGNGVYEGKTSTPPVLVTGDAWAVTIQNNPGDGFVTSAEQITFPTQSAGLYRFDIQSDDGGGAGSGDEDFNDLVLTCSTPVSASDFLVYGNVKCYEGFCVNPCYPGFFVIDSWEVLDEVRKRPMLHRLLEELYPERLYEVRPEIGPTPDPPPFRPMMLPLTGDSALPSKKAQVLRVTQDESRSKRSKKGEENSARVTTAGSVVLYQPELLALGIDTVELGSLLDRVYPIRCTTKPMAGEVLRFLEYDRTNAEKAGGAYTGEGGRETLGVCVTDRRGNYIFRFQHAADFTGDVEAPIDLAPGEDIVVQIRPDVIVQILDAAAPDGVVYESAPYWNVPLFRRINICKSGCRRLPTACQGSHAIQAIGNIDIGAPQSGQPSWAPRVGFSNTLNAEGRITADNPDAPSARCAAWGGTLDFYACFLDHPDVTHYTIRYRRPGESWKFFQEVLRHEKTAKVGIPGYIGDSIGPIDKALHVGGGSPVAAKAYLNIENNVDFRLHNRDRKARISTWIYAPQPTEVFFRIEGYDIDGKRVSGTVDTIKLSIDNTLPDFAISSVQMDSQLGGDCALFTVPDSDPGAPLTVRFKANQTQGFLNAYSLGVRRGNIGNLPIDNLGPADIAGSYTHGSNDLICARFRGTLDDSEVDGAGYVTTDIEPKNGASWLNGQPFCTFAVQLSCSKRVTNGYNTAVIGYGPKQYLLGIQAS